MAMQAPRTDARFAAAAGLGLWLIGAQAQQPVMPGLASPSEPQPAIAIADSFGTPLSILDDDHAHDGVVGLQMYRLDDGLAVGYCSGTLINARTVVAAAHCVRLQGADDARDRTLGVRVVSAADGRAALDSGDFVQAVSHVVPEPYRRDAFSRGYDIAVIALDERITDVVPVAVLEGTVEAPGTEARIVGYGRSGNAERDDGEVFDFRRRWASNTIDEIGHAENTLLRNGLLFTDFEDPQAPGRYDFFGHPVATEREGSIAAGDSGGALLVRDAEGRWVLAGVISGGFNSFHPGRLTAYGAVAMYTYVDAVRPFLDAANPLQQRTARAGGGDWLDEQTWNGSSVPANLDPGKEGLGATAPARFFEVALTAPGTVRLRDAEVRIDALAVSGGDLEVAGAQLAVIDALQQNAGHVEIRAGEILAGGLELSGGTLHVASSGRAVDASGWSRIGGADVRVDGRLHTGALELTAGMLHGAGEIHAPHGLRHSGGALAATRGAGTLTVFGDLQQAPGAFTEVEITASGNGLVQVRRDDDGSGGDATLDGTWRAVFEPGFTPVRGQSWTVVEAEGELSGRPRAQGAVRTADGSPTVLQVEDALGFEDGQGSLRVVALPYAQFAENEAQTAVAQLLDRGVAADAPVAEGPFELAVLSLDRVDVEGGLQAALQSLNPVQSLAVERYGLQLSRALAATLGPAGAAGSPPEEARGAFLSVDWLDASGAYGDTSYALTAGVDRRFGASLRLGAAATGMRFAAGGGARDELSALGWGGSVYAHTHGDALGASFFAGAYAGAHRLRFEAVRPVLVTADTAHAASSATALLAGAEAGWRWRVGPLHAGPVARLRHAEISVSGYAESGAGELSALVEQRRTRLSLLELGLQVQRSLSVAQSLRGTLFARLSATQQLAGSGRLGGRAALAGDPSQRFVVPGEAISPGRGTVALGATTALSDALWLQASFEDEVGRGFGSERRVSLNARMAF